jgi:hypothetical protein
MATTFLAQVFGRRTVMRQIANASFVLQGRDRQGSERDVKADGGIGKIIKVDFKCMLISPSPLP